MSVTNSAGPNRLANTHSATARTSSLRQFSIAAGIGLVVLGIAITFLLRQLITDELQTLGIAHNEGMARSLSIAVYHHVAPVLAVADAGAPALALREGMSVQLLRRFLVEPLRGMRIVRIKIYSPAGRIAFSTDESQIGTSAATNEGYLGALAGRAASKMVHRDTFNVSDGIVENRDLLETYAPIRDPFDGKIKGVFEVYTDMTPLLQQVGSAQRLLLFVSLGIMSVMLIALFRLFRRTEASLHREEQAVAHHLGELRKAHDTLEQKVEERTRALAASEQRFKDVAEAAGEYIWEVDTQGRFTFVTERVRDVLGYSPEELIGRTPLEFAPEEDAEHVRRFLLGRDSGPFRGLEHRTYTRSGSLIWLRVSAVPMLDSTGATVGLRGACTDITTRKRAVEALGQMSLATEQSSEVVIITSLGGTIEYVNPAFTEISGYQASEVLGRDPSMLRAPGQPAELFADLWRTILAGQVWRGELCNQRKDGSLFWNQVSIFPLRDHAMNITHYVGLQSDITRKKEDELAVQAGAMKLKAVMESVTDAIITFDVKGIIELVNPAACTLFGYLEEELTGSDLRMLMPQSDWNEHEDVMTDCLETGDGRILSVGDREVEGLRKDGSMIPLELSVETMNVAGRTGFVSVLRDLTERRRNARELEAVRQSYFHREKMAGIGQLAAGIVHEVGNPVAAIVGAVHALRSHAGAIDAVSLVERKNGLEVIAAQADRLALMTREIADFARPRAVEMTLLDLNQVVRSALSLLRYDARVQLLELKLDLDGAIPALLGSADQLTQVILNLVLNAADAGQGSAPNTGFIEIRTRCGVDDVALSVRDDGIGMNKMTLHRARTAYFSTKQPGAGMGLGLSLCEDIVTQHGGQMIIDSKPGEGTTVTIRLPVDPSLGKGA